MRKMTQAMLLVGAFTLMLTLLAACGSSSAGTGAGITYPTNTPAPAATATTAPAATNTPATGGAATTSASIVMSSFNFSGPTTVTIKAGQAVEFDDPGGTHILVTGKNGTFTAAAGAPPEFASSNGVSFAPGDTKSIVFPNAGTFQITCLIHPSMQATIIVQ